MKEQARTWTFLAVVLLAPALAFGLVRWYEHSFTTLPVFGSSGHRMLPYRLRNQEGLEASLNDWKDRIVVANLFFSRCPVVCPKMLRELKSIQQSGAGGKSLLLVSFSVDPERDTPQRLRQFASAMDLRGNWQLLTGSKPVIYTLARKGLLAVASEGDGGPTDFIHSETLVLFDPQQRIRGFYRGTDAGESQRLIRDIGRLVKEYRQAD
jgi:protein SCO1/2